MQADHSNSQKSPPRTTKRTPKQLAILDLKAKNPTLTQQQIADLAKCERSMVSRTISQYGTDIDAVEAYKTHRSDIFAAMQHRMLDSITEEEIKRTPVGSRVLAACQLHDKERIERGLSDSSTKPLVQVNIIAAPGSSVSLGEQGKGDKA